MAPFLNKLKGRLLLPTREPRQRLVAAATVLIFVVAGWLFYRILFPPTLIGSAINYREELFAGNLRRLYAESPDWEKNELNLSGRQIDEIEAQIVEPKLRGIKFLGITSTFKDGLSGQAWCLYNVRLPSGRIVNWFSCAVLTPDGPRFDFLDVFLGLWFLDHINRTGDDPNGAGRMAAYIEGYGHDGPILDKIGLHGIGGPSPSDPVQTWALKAQFWRSKVSQWGGVYKNVPGGLEIVFPPKAH